MLLGNGDGTFKAAIGVDTGFGFVDQALAIATGDLTGDGKPDIVVIGSIAVSVILNNGNGTFASGVTYGVTGTSPQQRAVALCDINGDNHLDIAVSCYTGPSVRFLLNTGSGVFTQSSKTFTITAANRKGLAAANLSADLIPDLVVADGNSTKTFVGVLIGNGNGTFKNQVTYNSGVKVQTVALADVDGDGHPDIVGASLYSYAVSVLLNNGNGTFKAPQTFTSGIQVTTVITPA